MKKYRASIKEIRVAEVEVRAENRKHAITLIKEQIAIQGFNTDYSHGIISKINRVEEPKQEVVKEPSLVPGPDLITPENNENTLSNTH